MATSRLQSLSVRLTAFTLVICIGSSAALLLFTLHVLQAEMKKALGNQQLDMVSLMATEIDTDLQERFDDIAHIAQTIQDMPNPRVSNVQALLERHPELVKQFNYGAFVADANGVVVASVPVAIKRVGVDYSDRDFFQIVTRTGRATTGRPVMGKVSKRAVFPMAVPIRDAAGAVVGVVAGETTLDQPSFLDRIATHKFGTSGGFVLIDIPSRTVITATDKQRIMEALPPRGVNPTMDRHMEGEDGVDLAVNPRGIETVSATRHLQQSRWYVVANLPSEEAFFPIHNLERQILIWGSAVIGLAALLIGWNIRRNMSPLLQTASILDRANDTARPLRHLPVKRHDEIGVLTLAFNRRLAHLQRKERHIERLALFDQLTQLPNRRLFLDRLLQAMSQSARQGCHAALLYMDMDKFKALNDTHGHSAGDALLREVAKRLLSGVRTTDTVARLGGDEFVVIFNDLPSEREAARRQAQAMADDVRQRLQADYVLDVSDANQNATTVHFESSASIGVCVFHGKAISDTQLIQLADEAMYAVKRTGRNALRVVVADAAVAPTNS